MTDLDTQYEREGYLVARGTVTPGALAAWLHELEPHLGARDVDPYNPVDYRGPMPNIAMYPGLVRLAASVHGPDVGVYYQRILVKDALSATDARPWHQDTPYYMGFDDKTSVFVALTPMTADNGALRVCPGTHRYGSLGDVGSIDIDALGVLVRGTILLEAGDVLVMNGMLIHGGTAAAPGAPRRLLGHVVYQPASDPSTDFVVRGERGHGPRLPPDREREKLFHMNRVKRLRSLT